MRYWTACTKCSVQTPISASCELTYGVMSERKEWKAFRQQSKVPMTFLHKDELIGKYASLSEVPLPAVYLEKDNALSEVLSAEKLNSQKTVFGLIRTVKAALDGLI